VSLICTCPVIVTTQSSLQGPCARTRRDGRPILVCTVGRTVLHYDARCVADLHAMLKTHGDRMDLGGTDERKPAKDGTVEAWGRSPKNPVGG
jgi:hypothetical protein